MEKKTVSASADSTAAAQIAPGSPHPEMAERNPDQPPSQPENVIRVEGILDIDIHGIPYNAKKAEPAHLHYDVRYLFRLMNDNDNFTVSDESLAMRWCGFDEAVALTGPGSVARMLSKWKNL